MERKIVCPKCGAENLSWRSRCEACGEPLLQSEHIIPKFEGRGAGFWVAFISGIVGTGFFAFLGVATLPEYSYILGMLVIPVVSLALCWKWPLIAGILLIFASLLPPIVLWMMLMIDPGESLFMAFGMLFALFLMTVPLLVSGIIFIRNR